jgi:ABC-type sugar transport system substrate-binding protein
MKKTRRFVALLLAAVLALALFTACGAAEQPQSAIGKVIRRLVCRANQQQAAGQTGTKS